MKKLIANLIKGSLGKHKFQGLYEMLFRLSLTGMNYGNAGDFKQSGELYVLQHVRNALTSVDNFTVFDVGGNIGAYACTLADYFGPRATVHSFEPSKKTFERLQAKTKSLANVVPNNFGFGDIETDITLFTDKDGSGLASVYQRDLAYIGVSMDKSEQIRLTTIDKYCLTNNIERIHFLKLDIEGHEFKALLGAEHMLKNGNIDFIQFEFGGTCIDSKTFFRDFYFLLNDRFQIYRVLKDGLSEIDSYKVTHEIFESVNYLAIKK